MAVCSLQRRAWIWSCGRSECSYSRNPTFSPTVRLSNRAPLWNTIPMCSPAPASSSVSSPFLGTPWERRRRRVRESFHAACSCHTSGRHEMGDRLSKTTSNILSPKNIFTTYLGTSGRPTCRQQCHIQRVTESECPSGYAFNAMTALRALVVARARERCAAQAVMFLTAQNRSVVRLQATKA